MTKTTNESALQKTYFARGPFCWGRGKSKDEAIRNGKKNWPKTVFSFAPDAKYFDVFEAECEIWMDDTGAVYWDNKDQGRKIQEAEALPRRQR